MRKLLKRWWTENWAGSTVLLVALLVNHLIMHWLYPGLQPWAGLR